MIIIFDISNISFLSCISMNIQVNRYATFDKMDGNFLQGILYRTQIYRTSIAAVRFSFVDLTGMNIQYVNVYILMSKDLIMISNFERLISYFTIRWFPLHYTPINQIQLSLNKVINHPFQFINSPWPWIYQCLSCINEWIMNCKCLLIISQSWNDFQAISG